MSKLNKRLLSSLLTCISMSTVHATSPEECLENSLEDMRQSLIDEGKEPAIRWDIIQAFEMECGVDNPNDINALPENYIASPEERGIAPAPTPAQQDPILIYAENLAQSIEGGNLSICKALANNLRAHANSHVSLDPTWRINFIDTMFNKTPDICFK